MKLVRHIYRSQNAMRVGGSRIFVHFHDIVETARRNNAALGITGFLMFDRLRFHQILEGPEAQVNALLEKIQADARHRNIETLASHAIDRTEFPDWSMGAFLSDENRHPLLARHGIAVGEPVDAERFLRFATDFDNLPPESA